MHAPRIYTHHVVLKLSRAPYLYRGPQAITPKFSDFWWVTNVPHRIKLMYLESFIYG